MLICLLVLDSIGIFACSGGQDAAFKESPEAADTTAPTVGEFSLPASATTLVVQITSFTATDNVGVTGYRVTETSSALSATVGGWSETVPTFYTFATAGSKTLYAWAKDAAGNVSASRSASVVITLPDTMPPTVTDFSIPAAAATLTVPITSFTASDNVGVSGYRAAETPTAPSAGAAGWSASAPASYTFATEGAKTLYGWAKDAAGNVSASRSASVVITLPDTTPPSISAVLPPNDAPAVSTGTRLTVTFSEPLAAATLNTATLELRNASGAAVAAAVAYDAAANKAVLTPVSPLAPSTAYVAVVKGGSDGVKDAAENPLTADYGWAFASSASNPFGSGPGGPILIVAAAANPFSRYYAEILQAEGLNAFAVRELSSLSATILAQYDVVILGEVPLTSAQVSLFSDWVAAGGNLIAMRPDKQLAGLLGLVDSGTTLSEGYLLVDTSSGPGAGIVGQTIQFHGTADRYTLGEAAALATLYANATSATASPAVTWRSVGTNGGQAAAFTFDLARSVVYTRQGNPAWIGQERDGIAPLRSDDLFYGNAAGDPQPDWIDLNKVAIPQADEQQRLLANMIIRMNADKKPLPRFWYFPNDHEAVIVMSGDDHGQDGTAGRFDAEINSSPANCSVENWECIRSSSYLYPDPAGIMTDTQAANYDAAGFEIGVHINTDCLNYTADILDTYFSGQMEAWYAIFPSLPPPASHRQHCIAWSGYTVLPEEEARYGIRLDLNYYYWPREWISDRPGFFTGSGLPMRFAALDGTLIDVYQAATQMTDETGQTYPYTIDILLDRAFGPEKYYGVFTANMHTDYAVSSDYDALIASAQARAVPVIAARQMLSWLDGRNGSSFGAVALNNNVLSFTISVAPGADGLQAMVPVASGSSVAGITRNGSAIGYAMKNVKGINYAVFYAQEGAYAATINAEISAP